MAAAQAAPDAWPSREAESWRELVAELRSARPLQRRLSALRWWFSRWLDPAFRRHALLPLDQHAPALVALLGRIIMVALAYVVLHTLNPAEMRPGHMLWIVCLVWLVAFHAGELFERFSAPKALGMLLAGVLLRSMPGPPGHAPPLAGLDKAWSRDIRAGAMALVFLRTGIGLNLSTLRAGGASLLAFVTLPSLIEALISALVAMKLFHMPFVLALTLSFMVAAVGPGALSAGCAAVKERGYAPRAPNFLMTGMCFDDVTCIVGFNCLLKAYLAGADAPSADAWGYKAFLLALLVGSLGGVAAAAMMACTAVWCTPARRSGMLLVTCAMLMYVASDYEQTGTGAIANLMLGLCTRHAWRRGWPFGLLSGEHRADVPRAATRMLLATQRHLGDVWHAVMYPLLFGFLGASFDVSPGPDDKSVNLGRATIYVFAAIAARIGATAIVTHPMRRFTPRERLYLSLAWCTKSTMQAAFATVPRHLIGRWILAHGEGATLRGASVDQLRQWGEDIHGTCVMSALLSTVIGTICINSTPYFLLGRQEARCGAPDANTRDEAEAVDTAAGDGEDDGEPAFASGDAGAKLRRLQGGDEGAPSEPPSPSQVHWGRWPPPPPLPADAEAAPRDASQLAADSGGAEAPAAAPAPTTAAAAAAPRASIVFTYSDVPPAHQAAVHSVLFATGASVAELLPGGAALQLVHDELPSSTHPNVFEDPNEDAGAPAPLPPPPPPSALRARRVWRRQAGLPCVGPAPSPRASLPSPPPLPMPPPPRRPRQEEEEADARPRSAAVLELGRSQPPYGEA